MRRMFDDSIRDQESRRQEADTPLDDISSAVKNGALTATKLVGDTLGVDTSIITNTLGNNSNNGNTNKTSSGDGQRQTVDPQCQQMLETSMSFVFKLTKFL